jgi:hypothetical protein
MTEFDAARFLDAAAPALGLAIGAECRPGVLANLARNHEVAQLVMAFPLADEAEQAPVFTP